METYEIIKKSGLHEARVINIYFFGSRIYGTNSDKSDYDVLIVAKTPWPEREIVVDNLNIHILSKDRFLEGLKQHNIRNIECLLSPKKYVSEGIEYTPNIKGLRHSISHTVSNSWVKCKKKLEIGEYYIGIKSMYHSLRIAMFGIDLAKNGVITKWNVANDIWDELQSKTWTWDELNEHYRGLRNKLMSEFKLLTEK